MSDQLSSPEMKTYAGVKWGLQNPSVIIVGVHHPGPQDNLVLVHEFYRDGVLLPEMVAAAKELADCPQDQEIFLRSQRTTVHRPAAQGTSCGRWRSRTKSWPGLT